ncbi:Alcohol dehydrogenase, partial [Operophtera brumata]
MAIYSTIFAVIIAFASYVAYQKYVTVYTSFVVKPLKTYDYIIGCVLAARLSEDPGTKVLLIEAGDHMGYFTKVPLTATAAQQGPNDWAVKTTRQKYSSFGMWNQTQLIPRGKGLGGSGQINFLLHGFGLPSDFTRWNRHGFKGWLYEDLKRYFIKAFGTVRDEFDSEHCPIEGECPGVKAPMKLKLGSDHDELMTTFRQASSILQGDQTTFKRATATIRFENKIASSLYILQNHRQLDNIFVSKEIILSAGVFKTPQILMLSGIGPKKIMEKLKIQPVSINEAVGQNLHDNMNMAVYVSIQKPISVTLGKVFSLSTVWKYFWSSSVMLFAMGTASERLLRDLSNYKPKEGFMWLCSCLQPRSRAIRRAEDLISTKPFQDLGAVIHWPRPERCLSFWNYSIHEQRRPPAASPGSTNTVRSPPDEYLACVIREVAVTGHHAGGTCAGGR